MTRVHLLMLRRSFLFHLPALAEMVNEFPVNAYVIDTLRSWSSTTQLLFNKLSHILNEIHVCTM